MRLVLDDATARSDDGDESATLRGEVERLTAANTYAEAEIARLTAIIAALQRHRFGARSEKLDAEQLDLVLEDLDQALSRVQAATEAAVPSRRNAKPRRTNRGALPAHLERIEQVITPASTACPCCAKPMHVIGEDVAERLDVVPASFRVLVTKGPC
jgi:transposase